MFDIDVSTLPFEYALCALVLAVAVAVAIRQRGEPWFPAFIAVLGTATAWYMVEPLYFDDYFALFPQNVISVAYASLFVFLVSFIVATPVAVRMMRPTAAATHLMSLRAITADQIVPRVVMVWVVLLVFGIYRMEGNVLSALFPIEGRGASNMWSRSAGEDAGPGGFLVSTAAYIYMLVLSFFGLLYPITKRPTLRYLLVFCMLVSWPYAVLQGSRHVTLAVITPGLVSYLLYARKSPLFKGAVAVGAFIALDLLMRAIIQFRDVGFEFTTFREVEDARHLGLNMATELIFITELVANGQMALTYGMGYVDEILNVVPRAIWADKPFIGIDYAVARGFGGSGSDIGVFATVSTGMVGQGVLNFGSWFGPMFAAVLMASWVGLLTRLRMQGGAARSALFLVGLGLTFNLGRNITLLVLYPFVFGYLGILFLDMRDRRKQAQERLAERSELVAARSSFS